jgi:hypothetical protein
MTILNEIRKFFGGSKMAKMAVPPTAMLPVPSAKTLPGGRTSHESYPANAGTIGHHGFYNLPFQPSVFDELLRLEGDCPDVAHAVHLWMEFANTGHRVNLTGSKRSVETGYEVLGDLAERLGRNTPGADGLVNAYLRQLGLFGCISSEDILTKNFSGVDYVDLVRPKYIRLAPDGVYQLDMHSGAAYLLSPVTYAYYAYMTLRDSPYAAPPVISAMIDIASQREAKENLRFIIKKLGLFGLMHTILTPPRPQDGETESEYQSRLSAHGEATARKMTKNMRDGNLTTYNDIELKPIATSNSGETGAKLFQELEQQIFTGIGLDPAMAGRSYSTTETYAGVVYRLLCRRAESFQRLVKRRLERTYRLELALKRIADVEVSITFHPLPSLTPDQDAARALTQVQTVLAKIEAGIIDLDTAATELGYEKATGKANQTQTQKSLSEWVGDDNPFVESAALAAMDEEDGFTEWINKILAPFLAKIDGVIDDLANWLGVQKPPPELGIDSGISDAERSKLALDWADKAITRIKETLNNAPVLPDIPTLTKIYKLAWIQGLGKSGLPISKALSMPDTRTIRILSQADGMFLSKHMWNNDYGAKARDWMAKRFFEEGHGVFNMTQETINLFRTEFAELLKETTDHQIRRVLITAVVRVQNWGIIERLPIGRFKYAKVSGPNDQKTCLLCQDMLGRVFLVADLVAGMEIEKFALARAVQD